MEERKINIRCYRNLGTGAEGKFKWNRLVLNTTLDKEHIGGLVTIIGPNNSGKSNVLSAMQVALGGGCYSAN